MKNNNFLKILLKCIVAIFLICFGFILISLIFNKIIIFKKFNWIIILIGIIIYSGYLFLIYKILTKTNISEKKYVYIFMAIYAILQILIIIFLPVEPSWDFKVVFDIVTSNNSSISESIYFYQFQNNVLFAYLLKLFLIPFKLIKIKNLLIPAMIINAIVLDLGLIFVYRTINLIFKSKSKKILIYLLFTCLPILLYVPIIYTDTIAFTLISIICYYSVYFLKRTYPINNFDKKDLLKSIFLGLIIGIGINIKFTIIILFIAFLIIVFFKKNCLRTYKYAAFSILSMILIIFLNKTFITAKFNKDLLNDVKVPATHWIMMGLHNYGNYNYEDYQNTFDDYKLKIKYNKKEISNRIKKLFKTKKILTFYMNKNTYLWGDGTLYSPELLRLSTNKNIIHEFILSNGKYFNIFAYYLQVKHILLFILMLLSPILKKRNKNDLIYYFIICALIGYFLFFNIWEVSSRYLFHILPIMLIACFYSINGVLIKKND